VKLNAFSRRRPTTKPSFSRKRNQHCFMKIMSKNKRERNRKKRRGRTLRKKREKARPRRGGSSGAECIQSEPAPKPPFSHEKKLTQSQEEKEKAEQSEQ
jgi:hypothetical protein